MVDASLVAGISGMSIILILFILNQLKKLSTESVAYDAANAVGAFLLAYYAFALKAWPFFVLNLVWGGFSLFQVIGDTVKRKKKH